MATADQLAVLNNKQSLGLAELRERLFGIIDKWDNDVVKALWDEDGWFVGVGFNGPPTLSSPATGKFQISTTIEKGTDGLGNLITLDKTESFVGPHDFENADGVDYYVGLTVARVPTVIKTSVESGEHQYTAETEVIGRSGEPLTVVDNGTTLTFRVDTVTEVSRSNAGRQVMVYLKDPVSGVEAVAIETRTVQYDGTNYIETAGLLGQTAGSASITPSDYVVVLLGPRVSRDTDLSALDAGTLFIGTMEGDSGAPVSVFDYSAATIMIPIPDLWNVLRYGQSDDLKIEVKQNAGDNNEAQISIKHLGGETTFEVNEKGEITIRDSSGGATELHIDEDGNIQEFGGLIKSDTETIELDDVNTTAPVPLSDSDQTGLPADMQDKTIIGIAEGLNTGDLWSKVVLSGCELTTSPVSYDVDFGAGTVLYKGFKYDKKATTTPLTMPASVTRYAKYSIPNDAWALDDTFDGDLDDDWIYVARLKSDGSGVFEVIDLRAPAYRIDRRFEYLVGNMEDGGAYETNIPHFQNIGDALKAIDVWANDATQKRDGPYRIRVIGKCEEADAPLQMPIDGIEIVGSRARRENPPYGPFVGWTTASALFDLNGKDRIIFKDLHMIWGGGATPGGGGAPIRVCFVNSAASGCDTIRVQNCYAQFGDGFFYVDGAYSYDDVLIENCTTESQGTCGVVFHDTTDLSGKIRVKDCDFTLSGNFYTNNARGISLRGWTDAWVSKDYIDAPEDEGIFVQSCGVTISECSVGAGDDGIVVQSGCTGSVHHNRLYTLGGDGIACHSPDFRIVNNRIADPATYGINIASSGAEDVLVSGNHIDDANIGIRSIGPKSKITKNHVAGSAGDGIEIDAARIVVDDNYIQQTTGRAVDINSGCDDSAVTNNTIEGTTVQIYAVAGALHVSVCGNHLDGGVITVLGPYPIVNGNHTKGGNIILANSATQKGVVVGNNLRLSAVAAGSITAHGQDDVAHNIL